MPATSRRRLTMAAIGVALVSGLLTWALKPRRTGTALDPAVAVAADEYTCPMHPHVTQPSGGSCPSCGMPLVKRSRGELQLSTARQQLIGLRYVKAEPREMTKTVIAAGTIAADESKITDVFAEVTGTVEQVLGNPVGQQVHLGDPLFTVVDSEGAKSQIHANATGHIFWRVNYTGGQVTPRLKVCTIYDHSTVWTWAEVYESDIAAVKSGQAATMTVPAFPGHAFTGTVALVSPTLQPETHTMKVRIDFANPEYLLKPGMSAIVEIASPLGSKLAIPEDSVIRTGTENVVFVSKGDGRLDVRDVGLGVQAGGWYEVRSGLEAGDELVATATSLVDAESRLQGIRSAWNE